MPPSDLEYGRHIYHEKTYLLNVSQDMDEDSFSTDETIKRAFVRSIEIIGEASKKISEDFKTKNNRIDWRSMAKMRDKLIHGYFGIDYEIVWDVIISEIPKLHSEIQNILQV
jgi:uncharacterized protein with HEPN domain